MRGFGEIENLGYKRRSKQLPHSSSSGKRREEKLLMEAARTVKDVSPHEFVKHYAAHLKRSGKVELPDWTDIVKTARFKELAPYDSDWYYIRAASIARKIYLRQGIGVGGFQKIYGGRQRNGSRPPHFCKSSGSIARHILQQLQKMSIIEIDPKGTIFVLTTFSFNILPYSGRRITSSGQRDLDQVAGRISAAH
ncbi:Protein component of the small (40S) ribosomal subunit [Asimina triloba]